nr:MAG TPA: hypothetical protein [Caudoviricetes sp.]
MPSGRKKPIHAENNISRIIGSHGFPVLSMVPGERSKFWKN